MHFILIFLAFFISSCVTVQVGSQKHKRANSVEFNSPKSPFEEMKTDSADRAWQSNRTGNIIAYQSQCESDSEPTLDKLAQDAISPIDQSTVLNQEKQMFNSRQALNLLAKGQVDGVPIQIALIAFKKNSCSYVITYNGVDKYFSNEIAAYEEFKRSFKAP